MFRNDPHMRCISLIASTPEMKSYIEEVAQETNCHVVFSDQVAELDDLDFVDRYTAFSENYQPDQYRYNFGSLWARREQVLKSFWFYLEIDLDDRNMVPVIFTMDTVSNDAYD